MRTLFPILMLAPALMAGSLERVIQTNSAGDNVHVIDPAINKVVGVIEDIEVPHGVHFAPDVQPDLRHRRVTQYLDVVDAGTLKVIEANSSERTAEQSLRFP